MKHLVLRTHTILKNLSSRGDRDGGVYGGDRLSIDGENLGLKDVAEPIIKVGPYPCVNVTVNSETNVECTTTPGSSTNHSVTLTIHDIANVVQDKLFDYNYNPPLITDVVGETPWYGNTTLLIFGKHLGTEDVEDLDVRIGGVSCLLLEVINEGELRCNIRLGVNKLLKFSLVLFQALAARLIKHT